MCDRERMCNPEELVKLENDIAKMDIGPNKDICEKQLADHKRVAEERKDKIEADVNMKIKAEMAKIKADVNMNDSKKQQELEKLKQKGEEEKKKKLEDGCGKLDLEELRTISKLMDYDDEEDNKIKGYVCA